MSFANRRLLLGHMIENKKSEKRKGKEIRKEKKKITPSHDKVVPDYNRDDNNLQGEFTGGRGGHTWQVNCEFFESFKQFTHTLPNR